MNTFIYFLLGLAYICILIWGIRLSKYDGLFNLSNVLLIVILGLVYDNFIIALGEFIGEGSFLENLSIPRYWLHALFTPTLILFAWNVCYCLGVSWAKRIFWKVLAYLISIGLIFYELVTSLLKLGLQPKWEYGILTYEAVQSQHPIMVILITIVLALVGFILLKNFHFSWLLLGTLFMIIGSFLSGWLTGVPVMNTLEFILIFALINTRQFQVQNQFTNQ
ncbi:hypothetical protein [Ureibacillus manganicus]|uniref:hypothetical protein n=1 Tax=Ureibacillus manganicus TaxID=1266064 RepID=UPI00069066C9|nr:hypothetical protein [Ureibacillus manganicus]